MLFLLDGTRNYTEDTRQHEIIHDDITGHASSRDIYSGQIYIGKDVLGKVSVGCEKYVMYNPHDSLAR